MSEFIYLMDALGVLKPLVAVTVAFGAIALYFGFFKKA
jgi:hypothetical protein